MGTEGTAIGTMGYAQDGAVWRAGVERMGRKGPAVGFGR